MITTMTATQCGNYNVNKTGRHDVAKIMLKVVLNTLAVEP
jgi:hypothetical protein